MPTWRLAKSLDVLRNQINAQFPTRSKSSDGTIGDISHSSRSSDHNPNAAGVVCAMDITNDPAHGVNSEALAEGLLVSRDPRIKYIISNRKIANSKATGGKPAWAWRPYTGTNPHDHHCHISVLADKADVSDKWTFQLGSVSPLTPSPVDTNPVLSLGARGADVERLQKLLNQNGFNITPDAQFGPKTLAAVKLFQAKSGLVPDGVVGVYTWEKLTGPKKSALQEAAGVTLPPSRVAALALSQTPKGQTMATVTVPVESATVSKINWTALVSAGAAILTVATGGKLDLSPETQLSIVTGIGLLTNLTTVVFRTWFTRSVTPQAAAKS